LFWGQVSSYSINSIETIAKSYAEKEDLKSIVTEAAKRNVKVNNRFLSRRFHNIARMAPDVLDPAVAAIRHPALGLGAAVKKIADKAIEETKPG
jgi:hypothetical protein